MFSLDNFIDGRALTSLSESVRLMFESITTQAQTKWNQEHGRAGQHTHITAATVTTNDLTRTGRLAVSFPPMPPTTVHPSRMSVALPFTGSPYRNLQVPSTVGFLRLTTDDVFNTIVNGIDGQGRQAGDLLCVANASPLSGYTISLSLWDTNAEPGGIFDGTRDVPGATLVSLPPGRWVWLFYDIDEAGVRAWRVHV